MSDFRGKEEIVSAVQRRLGLEADGDAGSQTWSAIEKAITGSNKGRLNMHKITAVQRKLSVPVDGNDGPKTWAAVAEALQPDTELKSPVELKKVPTIKAPKPAKSTRIADIQKEIGVEADGNWGEASIIAAEKFLRKLMDSAPDAKSIPYTDQKSLSGAYGKAGDESKLVSIDVTGLGVKYDGQTVKSIRVNKACADSLLAIVKELSTFDEGKKALSQFGGVFNNRNMRGGNSPSLHARGAAIDLMAGTNGNLQSWPKSADMPWSVIKTFAKHGWLAAGPFWDRDAMHFQRTK